MATIISTQDMNEYLFGSVLKLMEATAPKGNEVLDFLEVAALRALSIATEENLRATGRAKTADGINAVAELFGRRLLRSARMEHVPREVEAAENDELRAALLRILEQPEGGGEEPTRQ